MYNFKKKATQIPVWIWDSRKNLEGYYIQYYYTGVFQPKKEYWSQFD